MLTVEINNINHFSINSSIDRSAKQKDTNKSNRRKSYLDHGNAHRNKNNSFMESSNFKIKNNENIN